MMLKGLIFSVTFLEMHLHLSGFVVNFFSSFFSHQVLMVRFASLFDAKERTVTFLSGKKYSVDDLHSMGAGDLLNSMFEFSEKLNALQLSDEEMSLFTAVVLVSAGKERKLTCTFPKN